MTYMKKGRFQVAPRRLDGFLNLIRIVQQVQPDEIYNLAAQSHVRCRSKSRSIRPVPMRSAPCACWRRSASLGLRKTRFYQASRRTLRTGAGDSAEGDDAVLSRARLMGWPKLYAYWFTVNYREAYGIYA